MTRDLCIMACVFCRDPVFLDWLWGMWAEAIPADGPEAANGVTINEAFAKTFILAACQIASRTDLDRDPAAAARFHELVRVPFLAWKEAQS